MIILAVSGGLIWLFFSSSSELTGRDAVFCRPWGGCGGRVEGSWLVDGWHLLLLSLISVVDIEVEGGNLHPASSPGG